MAIYNIADILLWLAVLISYQYCNERTTFKDIKFNKVSQF